MNLSIKSFVSFILILELLTGLVLAEDQYEQKRNEVMRPTQHGIRLTPEMARAGARIYVEKDLQKKLDLNPGQRKQMAEKIARRAMTMGHTRGADLQTFTEYFFQAMCDQEIWDDDWPAEQAQEFAEQVQPLLPEYSNFLQGMLDDARSVLNEKQYGKFAEEIHEAEEELEEFQTRMDRWAQGDVRKGENPFETPSQPEELEKEQKPKTEEEIRRERILRHARWRVNRVEYEYGPKGWRHFLGLTAMHYGFEEQQVTEAEKILEDFEKRYQEVANKEWQEKIRKNRIKRHLSVVMQDIPQGPWRYHLDRAFDELVQPIKELDSEYRRQILSLATADQRGAAIDKIRKKASQHGLRFSRWDLTALQLAVD